MSKIKVSKEVAIALDTALKVMDKEKFFEEHSNKFRWTLDIYLPLNQISNWEMAQILINGYEVEKTPEERLVKKFSHANYILRENLNSESREYARGIMHGIKMTLEIKGEKIKGIND